MAEHFIYIEIVGRFVTKSARCGSVYLSLLVVVWAVKRREELNVEVDGGRGPPLHNSLFVSLV